MSSTKTVVFPQSALKVDYCLKVDEPNFKVEFLDKKKGGLRM